jgi:hypothetical protein
MKWNARDFHEWAGAGRSRSWSKNDYVGRTDEIPTGSSANLTLQDYGRFTRRPEGIVLKAQCESLIYDLSVEVLHYNYRVHCRGAQHEPGLSHCK